MHYLHHRYFECNYGAGLDGAILPLDKWLGTFHDGSDEAQERMISKLRESDWVIYCFNFFCYSKYFSDILLLLKWFN